MCDGLDDSFWIFRAVLWIVGHTHTHTHTHTHRHTHTLFTGSKAGGDCPLAFNPMLPLHLKYIQASPELPTPSSEGNSQMEDVSPSVALSAGFQPVQEKSTA